MSFHFHIVSNTASALRIVIYLSRTRMEHCIDKPKSTMALCFSVSSIFVDKTRGLCTNIAEKAHYLPVTFPIYRPRHFLPTFSNLLNPPTAHGQMEAYQFCFYKVLHWHCCGAFSHQTPVRRTFNCIDCPVTLAANGTLCQPRRINVRRMGKCLRCRIREARRARGECEEDHRNLDRQP